MHPPDKTYRFYLSKGDGSIQCIEVRRSDYPLTQIEEHLLVAALLQEKGYRSSLWHAGTGKILKQALRLSGMSLEALDDLWSLAQDDSNPTPTIFDEYFEALVRLADAGSRKHVRFEYALFEGAGNWGLPGELTAAFPEFTACRVSCLGQFIAEDLLKLHPEFYDLQLPKPPPEPNPYEELGIDSFQFVPSKPPRCIAALNPKSVPHSKPTLLLPSSLSVYSYGTHYDLSYTTSFTIGCPCGEEAVFLLGYYSTMEDDESDNDESDKIFIGPLSIDCPKCGVITEFFDTRKHGYDGEQGVNTHIIGEGVPERFSCPRCGVMPMILHPNFCYVNVEELDDEKSKDNFGGFNLDGQCVRCNALVEITSLECA